MSAACEPTAPAGRTDSGGNTCLQSAGKEPQSSSGKIVVPIPEGAAASSTDGVSLPPAVGAGPAGSPLLAEIALLKQQQKDLRDERKRVQKDLKNAERKRTRLRKKARQLSDSDLIAVLAMRHDGPAAEKAAAKTEEAPVPAASAAQTQPAVTGGAAPPPAEIEASGDDSADGDRRES